MAHARAEDPTIERRDVNLSHDEALGALIEACSPNLFGSAAVVVAYAADFADEAMIATLVTAARDGDVRLVVVHPAGQRGRKVSDALKGAGFTVAACDKLKGRAVDDFIAREFKTLRRAATPQAVEALRLAVGDSPRALAAACAQLVSELVDDPVTPELVAVYYEGVSDVPGYLVSDAVLSGRALEVMRHARWALVNDPGAGPALSAAVGGGLRGLGRVAASPRGASDAEVAKEAGVPPFKVGTIREQAKRWHPSAVASAIVNIAIADAAVKGRAIHGREMLEAGIEKEQGTYVLERALINIVNNRSR
jgi:DNA polymerase-3 subunit delta